MDEASKEEIRLRKGKIKVPLQLDELRIRSRGTVSKAFGQNVAERVLCRMQSIRLGRILPSYIIRNHKLEFMPSTPVVN